MRETYALAPPDAGSTNILGSGKLTIVLDAIPLCEIDGIPESNDNTITIVKCQDLPDGGSA